MNWEDDWRFRRLAEVLWRDDMRLAESRQRGHTKAWRTMQARYEGFQGLRQLARVRTDIEGVVHDMKAVLG